MIELSDYSQEVHEAAKAVSQSLGADIIAYSGDIDTPVDYELLQKISRSHSNPNVLLLLTTSGGDADSAFRMARCLHRHYKDGRVTIFVDWFCKSAGSLVTIGGDELIMSDRAELGPLDIQLAKPDELFERLSGLTPIQALTTLRNQAFKSFEECFLTLRQRSGFQIMTKTAAEIAVRLTVGLFRPIYGQLDPMRLGEIERAMMIAHQYGERLNRGNLREGALERLIASYPSHGFIIDREEAESLFKQVRVPTNDELLLANLLLDWTVNAIQADKAQIAFYGGETEDEKNQEHQHGETRKEPAGNSRTQPAAPAGGTHSRPAAGDRQPEPNGKDTRPKPDQDQAAAKPPEG